MSEFNDGRTKMEVDYSSTVDTKIIECNALVRDGKVAEAIEVFVNLEKQTRLGADAISTGRILVEICKICYKSNKFDLLNENILNFTKKRGQLKQAVTKMVQEAFTYVNQISDMAIKLKLIETLRTVTAGKIYVENEGARLSLILSKIKESEGNITEAASIMQELQVETFGTMEKNEKVDFILEQMRLSLARDDHIRAQIVSKKISIKYFDDVNTHEQKLKYYGLMIELGEHEGSFLTIARHYMSVYNTPVIMNDPVKRNEALSCVVLYLILSPFDNEHNDFLHRIQADPNIEHLPVMKELLEKFTRMELMNWQQMCKTYECKLRSLVPGSRIFGDKTEGGVKRWAELKSRVNEHNIRVMEAYYTRIRLVKMADLLDLSQEETEDFLSNMVVNKSVHARIDRLEGIVNFRKKKDPNEILNDWSANANQLMALVNRATHLINKEEMMHKLH